MTGTPEPEALGTLLRHIHDRLDADVAAVYRERGAADYRPRFSPPVRALVEHGPMSIRALANRIGVTHSAASQTVAAMRRAGFAELRPGADARQQIVHLTERTRGLLPLIDAEWTATATALRGLDAELPMPLGELLGLVDAALRERSFRRRIAEAGLDDSGRSLRTSGPGAGRPTASGSG